MNKYKVFFSYFKPHVKLFLLDMICALIISFIDLAFPFISRICMYNLLPEKAYITFFSVIVIMFFAYVLRSIFAFIIGYYGHRFGILVETDMRNDAFLHIQELGVDYFDNIRVGQLLSRLTTDLFDITELAHHGPEDAFISVVTIVGAVVIMFTIEWRLALVIAVMIPAFLLVVWKLRINMMKAAKELKSVTALVNADFESNLSGIRTAKAFSNEIEEYNKFNKANNNYRIAKYKHHRAMAIFNAALEFMLTMLPLAVIAVGGILIMKEKLNIIELITFSLYITVFVVPIRKLAGAAELFTNGIAGLERFTELLSTKATLFDDKNAKELADVKGLIDIRNVVFAYDKDVVKKREVLKDITIKIKEGETVAFVGPSGGGKTTLAQLILRFYDVDKGSILIDNQDVRMLTQESLHKNIGVVQQDVFLFPTTIFENIRYGKLNSSREEVIDAAKKAEIYDDIMDMKEGFDSFVGERGVKLSGGQKQRISIARIFLKDPKVLILDEATSALDGITEVKIQKTIDKLSKGRTVIVIAHRLSTIKNADKVVLINNGKVEAIGTYSDLIVRSKMFLEMVEAQEI